MDIISNAGGAGSLSFDDSPSSVPATGRGRVRSADCGMPERPGLVDLARTYLDAQARSWPDLAGTPAVPAVTEPIMTVTADDFERRFRDQAAEVFAPGATPRLWEALGVAYLRFSDENSNRRSLDQQLLNVLNRARRDGVFIPWQYVLADAAVSGTLAYRRAYTIVKTVAAIFTEGFVTDLAAEVNSRLAEIARRPLPSTKKLEQEITNLDRQLKRVTERLEKAEGTHLDAVIAKADDMGRQQAGKREQLKELQRAGRRPGVTRVREQDVVAALGNLRELLDGNVGIAAQVLKALVGAGHRG